MNYEEKVINEVLHFRICPDGRWWATSAKELTRRLVDAKNMAWLVLETATIETPKELILAAERIVKSNSEIFR